MPDALEPGEFHKKVQQIFETLILDDAKLEDIDMGSLLDEFIAGVRAGNVDAELMWSRSVTGRAAWHKNAVAGWLKYKGFGDQGTIAGVISAFESAGHRAVRVLNCVLSSSTSAWLKKIAVASLVT